MGAFYLKSVFEKLLTGIAAILEDLEGLLLQKTVIDFQPI